MAQNKMVKGRPISNLVSLVIWLTGILVSLAVGFGMADGVLTVKWIPSSVTMIAGWVVVVLTVASVVLAIAEKM